MDWDYGIVSGIIVVAIMIIAIAIACSVEAKRHRRIMRELRSNDISNRGLDIAMIIAARNKPIERKVRKSWLRRTLSKMF
jgi:hypothetical protein